MKCLPKNTILRNQCSLEKRYSEKNDIFGWFSMI
jgi:hypothetical protein